MPTGRQATLLVWFIGLAVLVGLTVGVADGVSLVCADRPVTYLLLSASPGVLSDAELALQQATPVLGP